MGLTGDTSKPTTRKVNFVADARLISVLGEQLIGSEKVGVLELVKNAYDAGAKSCRVTLEGVPELDPKTRTLSDYTELPGPIIEIADDGHGMNEDGIVNGWLRPATPRRAVLKEKLREERIQADARGTRKQYEALVDKLRDAHGGRLPLGEKGIGRLATHRLGRHLWIRTKTADDPFEWELHIDWTRFDLLQEELQDLSAVKLDLRHQPPTAKYGDSGSGTVICCYGGREGYTWTEDLIADVGRAVNALKSPFKAPASFEATFLSPHVRPETLASPLERVPAPFELVALVNENGVAEIDFSYTPPEILPNAPPARKFEQPHIADLRKADAKYWTAAGALRRPDCGSFLLHVRAYLRFREWLGLEYDDVIQHLDQFGGITIYRDGLATLPAQQSARTDWLGLAQAQIKRSANISYYQLSGAIDLEQEHTLSLRDRSSREGMIETRAYHDLAKLTRAAIVELQSQMQDIRDAWKKTKERRISPEMLRAHVTIAAKVGRIVAENYDFKRDPLKFAEVSGGKKAPERIAASAEALADLSEHLELQREEREGLLEVAGFGLAISVAVHEISKLAGAIASDAKRLRTTIAKSDPASEIVDSLRSRADSLLGETRRIAPLRVLRSEPTRLFSIRSAIETAKNAFVHTLQESHIVPHIERGDFQVRARFGQLAQVFANLFDNAIYWIGPGGGRIHVSLDPEARTVVVGDSGPGISDKIERNLFEPFYSQKDPPSGLGLYVSRHYLAQCKSTIRVAKAGERTKLDGAHLLLDFSKTPAE